ncbi:MAG TPA: HD domain-containing protein [Candidatus Saccharimonadales bacterium]
MASRIAPDLDTGKLLMYALAHDTVEIHAGDTFVFGSKAELDSKSDITLEMQAAEKAGKMRTSPFIAPYYEDLLQWMSDPDYFYKAPAESSSAATSVPK